MNWDRITPDEFARLMSLPEDHPDRRRAAREPEFEAHRRLLEEFESPQSPFAPGAFASAAKEVERRVSAAMQGPSAARAHESAAPRSWLASLWDAFGRPLPRVALALAAVAIVAGTSTWLLRQDADRAVRGGAHSHALEVAAPRSTARGIELEWTAVPEADGYRVVFYGADLRELARVGGLTATRLELTSGALPAGLASGAEVLAEVTALKGTDPIAVSEPRSLRVK